MGCLQSNLSSTESTGEYLHYKIIMLGDSNVGKSTLLTRFTTDEFKIVSKSTIGVERIIRYGYLDDKTIKFQFWDTNNRKRPLTKSYYNEAVVALIVYDITNRTSFKNLEGWLKELRDHTDPVIILVGTNSDLSHLRVVSEEEIKYLAVKEHVFWVETSALDDFNVTVAFTYPINKALEMKGQYGELKGSYCLKVN